MCLKPCDGQALSWGPTPHLKEHVIEKEQKKEAGGSGGQHELSRASGHYADPR